jgi:alpha-tubulin suppressor-like RCC1 family protein
MKRAWLVLVLGSCAPSTQITFDLRTDVPCGEYELVSLTVAPVGQIEARDPVATTAACSPSGTLNVIGTYAVVPRGEPIDLTARVVMALKGVDLEARCTGKKVEKGCITARRTVGFVPRRGLVVPIELNLVCEGVTCDEDSTCNRLGRCVPARVDVSACEGDLCAGTVPVSDSNERDRLPVSETRSFWTAEPATVQGDGVQEATLRLDLRDANGTPIPAALVSVSATGEDARFRLTGNVTDDAGVFVAFLSSRVVGPRQVVAQVESARWETTVTFVPPDGGLAQGLLVAAVSGGERHTCALSRDGGVWCWGQNQYGALGLENPQGPVTTRATPVPLVPGPVVGLATGWATTCGWSSTGQTWCWGYDSAFELGIEDGGSRQEFLPSPAMGGRAVRKVALGRLFSCLLDLDGGVFCVGNNTRGELGQMTATPPLMNLVPVPDVEANVIDLAAGMNHACAVLQDGGAFCWGSNTHDQCGARSPNADPALPEPVQGLPAVRAISAGGTHTCALSVDAGVWCWGNNASGQLGIGSMSFGGPLPEAVQGLSSGVKAISSGQDHMCALLENGLVRCWGGNYSGQLGEGSVQNSGVPVDVRRVSSVTGLGCGYQHCCAMTGVGLRCWGYNGYAELGDGTTNNQPIPVNVPPP